MTIWLQQNNSCSSLTLIIACIIYWQARKYTASFKSPHRRNILTLALISNISSVSWKNVILYGEYILNRNRVVQQVYPWTVFPYKYAQYP
ncbi:Tn3 family transposase [Nitrosomonas aestuarii]|uniref:Tn3 family transposase n=1 Tax=Nitrosomonas aestuarii TaxID=52441 RepID=UPI000D3181D3